MNTCESSCKLSALEKVKQTFMDRLIGRTIEEKINNHCHINCIKEMKAENFKRNGRWGFIPLFGFTEFFSSFFAFISFLANIYYFNRHIRPKIRNSPLRNTVMLQYYICNSAFISSTLFHMRETDFTRFADYFTAFLSILINLIAVIERFVHISFPGQLKLINKILMRGGFVFYVLHVYKMAFLEFDYVYNKVCCGFMFALLVLGDVGLYIKLRHHKHMKNILIYLAWLIVAGFTEILDISPLYFFLDSHAVWHLFMACSLPFYFAFLSGHIEIHEKEKRD